MIRVRRRTALLVLLAACSGKSAPVEQRRSDPQQLPPPDSARVVAAASAAPQGDPEHATSTPEPTTGAADPTTQPASPPTEEVPGRGSCEQDDDCVLSNYQPGCCTQGCVDYAINKRDLAAQRAKENCAARKGPCPPPAPCRRPTHRIIAAKCSAGACVAVREPISR